MPLVEKIKIAIVQGRPDHKDLQGGLEKTLHAMKEAHQKGADVVVFGECWLGGYPAWIDHCHEIALWDEPSTKKAFARMYKNGVEVTGEECKAIAQMARQLGLIVGIGINEIIPAGKANGTIFNSFLLFNEMGELVNHHRKLMPTYTEKMLYGLGDGHGLQVADTSKGRIGGLICWEHWMPLTRQCLHDQGEHFHLALWPQVHEMLQLASRHYAFEGRCFVIAVGQIMQVKDIPSEIKPPEKWKNEPDAFLLKGGSCAFAPDGQILLPPQWENEGIFIVDIDDTSVIYQERMTLDTSGHYQRKDVFKFTINRERIF